VGRGQGGGETRLGLGSLCVEQSRVTIALERQWPFETVTWAALCSSLVQRTASTLQPHHPFSPALAMLSILKRIATNAHATKSILLHNLESRGLSPKDTADGSAAPIQALPLPALPSIIPELSSMDIPPAAVDELCKLYDSSVQQIRSTVFDSYQALVADLGTMRSVDGASTDRLHKAVLVRYLKGVAGVKEDTLNAARRIAALRANEASPFKEVRYDFFSLLHETDVL
jgi:hypothetical protein